MSAAVPTAPPPATPGVPALPLVADPAVPHRDALLSGDAVARALRDELGVAVERCTPERAKYRFGESLRAVYRVTASGREHVLAMRTFRAQRAREVVAEALTAARPAEPFPPVAHLPALGAVFWTFPNDRKIADLPVLAGGAVLERLLGRAGVRAVLVAWAPESAATARVEIGGRAVAYAKVYAGDEARRARDLHAAVAGAVTAQLGAPRLPRPLAVDAMRRALLLEPLAGRPALALDATALGDTLERLGAALAVLHETPPPAAAPRFDRLDPPRLRMAAAVLARARPDVAGPAHALAEALGVQGTAAGPAVCLHGDPHLGNVVVDGAAIGLVDLDHVARGPAAADLARVLGGLMAREVAGELTPSERRALAGRLSAGYAAVRPLPAPEALAHSVAATLLARHALPAVGRVRVPVLRRLPALLDAAGEALR